MKWDSLNIPFGSNKFDSLLHIAILIFYIEDYAAICAGNLQVYGEAIGVFYKTEHTHDNPTYRL